MPSPTLATVWATDEHVARAEAADFPLLCPVAQKVASGSDGAILAGSFSFTSAVNFSLQGVLPGNMLQLTGPSATINLKDLLVVDTVAGTTITLRRLRMSAGMGQPPVGTNATGVTFLIATLAPQIEEASYEINRDFGLDDLVPGAQPSQVIDQRAATSATVALVLIGQYLAMARQSGANKDHFTAKSEFYRDRFRSLRDKLAFRISGSLGGANTATFNRRIRRG